MHFGLPRNSRWGLNLSAQFAGLQFPRYITRLVILTSNFAYGSCTGLPLEVFLELFLGVISVTYSPSEDINSQP